MIRSQQICSVILLASCVHLKAYEMPVHAWVTKTAFDRSALSGNPELYQRLGFDRLTLDYPFNAQSTACESYADAAPDWLTGNFLPPNDSSVRFRCISEFERGFMPLPYSGRTYSVLTPEFPAPPGQTPHLRFEAWLMRGAIREDDFASKFYANNGPDTDPWVDRTRVFNHFYSPVTNTVDTLQIDIVRGGPALNWALGEANPFSGAAQVPDPTRGNHFSYMDARRAYFFALTYKQTQAVPDPFPALNSKLDSNIRMNLWSTTLKSLGHVIHLMQDQASPQHSRGEPHNHTCVKPAEFISQDFATRTYENFINYRLVFRFNARSPNVPYVATNDCEEALWRNEFELSGQRPPDNIDPWNRPYPIPKFSVQRKFFTTRAAADPTDPALLPRALLNTRAGLGDYANRGFFTQDYQQGNYQSPPAINSPEFVIETEDPINVPGKGLVRLQSLYWAVPDSVAPTFADVNLRAGKAPIASQSVWCEMLAKDTFDCALASILSLRNYNQMADMLIPRAVAYTTGMLDFFFRGKLEIEPNAQRMYGVVDMGQPHTMNAGGYPVVTANGKVLGFEKIRLKVRNLTDPIIESGTNANVPQIASAGKLVAVARYHRNPCYKPDLSGERTVGYVAPPLVAPISEPTCSGTGLNAGTRTSYQEISVSAEIPITSETDLPGGRGTVPASVEKTFDFSADPIPVNATDLFIQVVYRGQLGEETDGIAVGIVDVQENTVFATWNNTDYYFSELANQWFEQNPQPGSFIARPMVGMTICAGNPSRVVYRYTAANGPGFPFYLPPLTPGVARLGFLFGKPSIPTGRYAFRVNPLMATPPSARQRVPSGPAHQKQANKEIFTTNDPLPAPRDCALNPPVGSENVWCVDPIKRRRGQIMGAIAEPVYYTSAANNSDASDVDAPPAHVVFPGLRVREGGVNHFDIDATPVLCPAPNARGDSVVSVELKEEAAELGIDLDEVRLDN